jgi:hypothetical protein
MDVIRQLSDLVMNDLEVDLLSTKWICDKVKQSTVYSQHLYAALCNNEFQKLEIISILAEHKWSCSWRRAGSIIAELRENGDYLDWYCSGTRTEWEENSDNNKYVSESVVTSEVREDLLAIGWKILDYNDSSE